MDSEEKTHLKPYSKMESSLRKLQRNEFPLSKTLREVNETLIEKVPQVLKICRVDKELTYHGLIEASRESYAIIFINPVVGRVAKRDSPIYVDGTFKTRPLDSAQVLNIFREIDDIVSYFEAHLQQSKRDVTFQPRFYGFALMTSRKMKLYKRIYRYVKDNLNLIPKRFTSDYEYAMRGAAVKVWPEIEMSGCTFHYRQAIRKNYMKKILHKKTTHKRILRMIFNLQMLSSSKIYLGSIQVLREQYRLDVMGDFLHMNKYYFDYWLKKITPRKFSSYRVLHRTNNFIESLNATMSRSLAKHPNIHDFLRFMHDEFLMTNQRVASQEIYVQQSNMTKKLEQGWQGLETGTLTIDRFLKTNFYAK